MLAPMGGASCYSPLRRLSEAWRKRRSGHRHSARSWCDRAEV